jgi:hypothetical protein
MTYSNAEMQKALEQYEHQRAYRREYAKRPEVRAKRAAYAKRRNERIRKLLAEVKTA